MMMDKINPSKTDIEYLTEVYRALFPLIKEAEEVGLSRDDIWLCLIETLNDSFVFKTIRAFFREHYARLLLEREGFEIIEHKGSPYDYKAEKDGKTYLIEVKSREYYNPPSSLHIAYYLNKWFSGFEVMFFFVKERLLVPIDEVLYQALVYYIDDDEARRIVNILKECREKGKRIPAEVYRKMPTIFKYRLGSFVE